MSISPAIDQNVRVDPTAVVSPGATLGEGVEIGPFCRVGDDVILERGVKLLSHVVVDGASRLGEDVVAHPFSVIGGPPQHTGYRNEKTALTVGPRTVIREHATINLGTPGGRGVTAVGADCFIMTAAHIAHDCQIGDNVIMANNATLGGHVIIEKNVFLGGLCAVQQNCRVGEGAFVGGCAAAPSDIIPFASATGNHATLSGLNIIGMKRRGMSRAAIHEVRAAFKALFHDVSGAFEDRLDTVAAQYESCDEVQKIVAFIRAGKGRALMKAQ
ncbi:MAG: acyl-ACP--UDP-N-acetylglucosamine O-acyltransferase [Pseudomonadota bacterium]